MRTCIVGAGAIGGYLAVQLARAGHTVTVIARGAHLEVIRANGLTLVEGDGTRHVARVAATDDFSEAGRHDVVLLALKAHQIAAVAERIPGLLEAGGVLVTLQNGIPWWYFHGTNGPYAGRVVESVDPGGVISRHVDYRRVVHSVAYPAATVPAPGVIRHEEGDRFPVGEPDGGETERVRMLSGLLTNAGLRAPVLADLRGEIWLKLLGNVSLNPISALTGATVIELLTEPHTRRLVELTMNEAKAVAESLGVRLRLPVERRIAGAERLGDHKMSMLQDVEARRPLEIDPLLGAVIELGNLTGTPVPCITALHACVKLLERRLTA